jgi:glycosyltransferase involved in cell wall biosynthesis
LGPNRGTVSGGIGGMTQRPRRVLLIGTHPVQYSSPMFRLYANDPRLEIQVAYCSLQGAEAEFDRDFGVEVKWDVPLLEGYPWVEVPNRSWSPGLGSFFGLFNPGIWSLIRRGKFDAVVFYTGYAYATFWMGIAAAKLSGVPILFGTDATSLQPRDAKRWKLPIKSFLLPKVFRLADVVIIPSEAGRQFILSMGISGSRVVLTPFVVDNTWWSERTSEVDRGAVRREWAVPEDAPVVLFCAKLQTWKRPGDVLNAFAKANVEGAFLVFAGDGPMRAELEASAKNRGIAERTRFLGFVNQTALPSVYRSADLFVLPSEYDPCPAVVCEAMLCGCPVVLSDEIRGRFDIVEDGKTGFIFPCGNVDVLAKILADALGERARLAELSRNAVKRMETWTPQMNLDGLAMGVERASSRQR